MVHSLKFTRKLFERLMYNMKPLMLITKLLQNMILLTRFKPSELRSKLKPPNQTHKLGQAGSRCWIKKPFHISKRKRCGWNWSDSPEDFLKNDRISSAIRFQQLANLEGSEFVKWAVCGSYWWIFRTFGAAHSFLVTALKPVTGGTSRPTFEIPSPSRPTPSRPSESRERAKRSENVAEGESIPPVTAYVSDLASVTAYTVTGYR